MKQIVCSLQSAERNSSCGTMQIRRSYGRTCLAHVLTLACSMHRAAAFTRMQVNLCAAYTRPSPSRASSSSSSASSSSRARSYLRQQEEWLGRRLAPEIFAFRVEKHHHQQLGEHDACLSCRGKKPLPLSAMRPDSAAIFFGNSSRRFEENRGRRPTLSASSEGTDEGGGGGGGGGDWRGGAQGRKKTRAENKKEKSVLGKAGEAAKATFNALIAAGTIASLLLAAETLWELHGTPLTLSNAVPTLSKLLPLTGIGVFGAAQLVGLVARVARVIVTLPIMLSGTWVILQNAPKLLPHGSDLTGAGSLAAVLATPEVLEAAAVVALLGGVVVWALNFATGAIGSVLDDRSDSSPEDDEFT